MLRAFTKMPTKFGGKSKSIFARGGNEGNILCMSQRLSLMSGCLMGLCLQASEALGLCSGWDTEQGVQSGQQMDSRVFCTCWRRMRGTPGCSFISMRASVEYRAGPPVKLKQSRNIHFLKIGDVRPWGSPILPKSPHEQAYLLPLTIQFVRAK